jgi:hypothetical protein
MLDVLQFNVLPFGSVLALLVLGWAVWHARRAEMRRLVGKVLIAGVLAGAALVATFHLMLRLPWLFACMDCLERHEWFSYAITFMQGFGAFASVVLAALWFYSGSRARNA